MSGDSIGMMEGAFFVSKGVILDWMNDLLDVSIKKSANNKKTELRRISLTHFFYSCNSPKLSSAPLEPSTAR